MKIQGRMLAIAVAAVLALSTWIGWKKSLKDEVQNDTKELATASSDPLPSGGRREVDTDLLDSASSISTVPLKLRLHATIPTSERGEGRARIGVSGLLPQTYSTGSVLANGARLTAVFADRVVLAGPEGSITLYLEGERRGISSLWARDSSLQMVGGAPSDAPPVTVVSTSISTSIRGNPVYSDGSMVGIEVFPARNSAAFGRLGLNPGDVITSIDGVPMTDPVLAWEVFQQLATGLLASVTISRRGSSINLLLEGQLLGEDSKPIYTSPSSMQSP